MSYQDAESLTANATTDADFEATNDRRMNIESISNGWGALLIFCLLLGITIIATVNQSVSYAPTNHGEVASLSKFGAEGYTSLSKAAKKALFDDFKITYSKSVRNFISPLVTER